MTSWAEKTMSIINDLTPDIKNKAFDPDWFLLRRRLERFEGQMAVKRPTADEWADWVVRRYIFCGRVTDESLREIVLIALRNVENKGSE